MRIARSAFAGALAVTLVSVAALPARAAVTIIVDKSTQQMTVAVDGQTRYRWPVSTGRSKFATPVGAFQAFRMEEDHFSKEWDDAPMPNSIFFTKRGHAIHGYLDTRRIGQPASHGCVRLEPANAKALFALVKEQGVLSTKVVITGDERIAERRPAPLAPREAASRPQDQYAPQQEQTARAPTLPPPQDIRPAPGYGQRDYADQRYPRPQYTPELAQRDYYGRPRYADPRYADPRYYDPRYDPPEYSPYYRRPRGYYTPPFFNGN